MSSSSNLASVCVHMSCTHSVCFPSQVSRFLQLRSYGESGSTADMVDALGGLARSLRLSPSAAATSSLSHSRASAAAASTVLAG